MPIAMQAICPYCGHKSIENRSVDVDGNRFDRTFFINCCIEDGGCDRDFAVEFNINVTVKTYALVKTDICHDTTYSL